MRQYVIAAATLVVLAGVSEAACTKKSLNGKWSVGTLGEASTGTMAGGTIAVNLAGSSIIFTVSSMSSSTCRGTGTIAIDGTLGTGTFAAEQIGSGSSRKPNHLYASWDAGGGLVYLFVLERQ